jgi:hypothetical protein
MPPRCAKCGELPTREVPNSTACWDCYRAALAGVEKSDIQAADRVAAAWTAREHAKLEPLRDHGEQ